MKKMITITLAVLLVVLCIAACTNKNGTATLSPTVTVKPSVSVPSTVLPSGTGAVYPMVPSPSPTQTTPGWSITATPTPSKTK